MRRSLSVCAVVGLLGVTLSARAVPIVYVASLSGAAEAPPNLSPGTGAAQVTYDAAAHTLEVEVSFSGLVAPTTAAHIHAPTALPFTGTAAVATQVPSFVGFPLGVTSGSFVQLYDLTDSASWRPAYITGNGNTVAGAEAALAAALAGGLAYVNIHTTQYPGGEIRGFLVVPDGGSTGGLLLLALVAVAWRAGGWPVAGRRRG